MKIFKPLSKPTINRRKRCKCCSKTIRLTWGERGGIFNPVRKWQRKDLSCILVFKINLLLKLFYFIAILLSKLFYHIVVMLLTLFSYIAIMLSNWFYLYLWSLNIFKPLNKSTLNWRKRWKECSKITRLAWEGRGKGYSILHEYGKEGLRLYEYRYL